MIDVSVESTGLVHLQVQGTIDATQMRDGLDAFFEHIEGKTEVPLLYTITDIKIPTPAALAVELGYIPQLFGALAKLKRAALIANQAWVRGAAKIESAVIPGLVIEVFEPGDEDAARAWVLGNS